MTALPIGRYFGRVPQCWAAPSISLSVVVHERQRTNVSHAHEAAFVTMMLDGQYMETAARRSVRFDLFTAVYHPPELEHQDFIGPPGTRLLLFEFRPQVLDGIATDRMKGRSVRDISGSAPSWQLLALYREAAAHDDDLQFESSALELLARVAPLAHIPRDRRSLERAREYVHAHFRDRLLMTDIASDAGVHPVHLGQAFRREYGETVGTYVNRLRVRAAAEVLSTTERPLAAIACEHGFCDQSHFQRVFKRLSGCTPAEFRRSSLP